MAKYFLTWELGGGLGHAMSLYDVACYLMSQGHEVVVALSNLDLAAPFAQKGIRVCPSPARSRCKPYHESPNSMAEILWCNGYAERSHLASMVNDWVKIIHTLSPDVIVADYAPTALLAAKICNIDTISIGSTFSFPPLRVSHQFRTMDEREPLRLAKLEKHLCGTINSELISHGQRPLFKVSEVFYADRNFVKSIPLLDYYSDIRAIQYVNPVRDFDHAMSARWQGTPYTDKVLAYLKPEYNQLDQLLEQMNECPETEFIIYLPDRSNVPTRLGHHIQCFNQPLTLGSLLAEANFVICHAGAGLVAQACLAQVPILCLPLQYEQYLTARQVHRQGLGIMSPKVLPNNFVVEAVKHNPVEVRHRESKLSQDVLSYAQVFS